MGSEDCFVFGMLFGAGLMCIAALVVAAVDRRISQCEKELPRYQHCELVAVPKLQGD